MQLNPRAREFYVLDIDTLPEVDADAWEASFDNGQTWVTATDRDGLSTWLVAGHMALVSSAVAVIRTTTQPLIRLADNPELVVREAPVIVVDK